MSKFMCLQRGIPSQGVEKPTPAQMEEMYAAFNRWREQFQSQLVDMGGKLAGGKWVSHEGESDGPFPESKEVIGGYMIVEAENIEQALEVAKACPGLVRPGSGVEVREILTP